MKTSLEIIAFLVLLLPTSHEVYDDRSGEGVEDKRKDVYKRIGFIFIWSIANVLMRHVEFVNDGRVIHSGLRIDTIETTLLMFGKAVLMSSALFFLIFDYHIHWVLGHKGWDAFTYLGKTSKMDRFGLWVKLGPWGRFIVRLIVFVAASIIYL